MNHDKVRIYDLSKELDVDNKEVLEICAQLNISAKSHSSTITEEQAQQIRRKAQQNISVSNTVGGYHTAHSETLLEHSKSKQEILAIHHKQEQEELSSDLSASNPSTQKPELSPPPRLQKPQSIEAKNPDMIITQQQDTSVNPITIENPSQLMQPPVRPEKPKPQVKPIAKKPSRKPETPVNHKTESDKPQEIEQTRNTEDRPKLETKAKIKVKPKGKLELQSEKNPQQESISSSIKPPRPQLTTKPSRPVKTIESEPELELDTDLVIEEEKSIEPDEVILLEKPKRNKQIKLTKPEKGKQWEEEEEEKAKSSKAPAKNKRRSTVIEEEEDLDALLEETGLASNVMSLAIARPPKPKAESPVSTLKPSQGPKVKKPGDKAEKRSENKETKPTEPEKPTEVSISGNLTVRSLAELIKISETEIIKNLFFKGIAVNITETLELETAKQVAEEFGIKVNVPTIEKTAAKTTEMLDIGDLEKLVRRPPVVTIMGHVDHGKTTLLDSIRKTKVAQGEAGGITQHIGAYHVDIEHNDNTEQIVFLDTPGHEAFTAMRARGAKVTDIAILVVAADDGVQPQTREAISHAKAAEVPIIVAINKVDKIEANPDRIKQELSELELVPEEWGGETIMVPVSALKGENLDTLLEMILLVAEVGELSANPDRLAKGTIIEAHLDRAKGPVATLLVQNGTLEVGNIILAGSVYGRIRAMIDDRGVKVEKATPSFAVEILGLNQVPAAGDEFEVFNDEKEARQMAEARQQEDRQLRLQQSLSSRRVSLTSFSEQAREGQLKELNLILKADVQGSVEAIVGALQQLPQNEVQLRILLASPGEVTETDVDLAAASGAVIIGFNTTLASGSRSAADREGVDVREYNIIYKLLDDIQGAMEGLLDPEEIEEELGVAEVRAIFPVGRGSVAGCYIQSGKVVRNRLIRVRRQQEIIYKGNLDSLKRMKEDVKEVNSGYECGIASNKFNDWKEGDIIEVYQMMMKRRTLSPN